MKIWDAIVVGAGPAGCACAYDLAAKNKSVLLLDKSEFPRLKACAGGLTRKTVRALRYSIEPVVRQSMDRIVLEDRDSATTCVHDKKSICVMTVRAELDAYCLKKTIQAGAVFQRIHRIEGIQHNEEQVAVTTKSEVLHGRFLVGADGVNSQVRSMTDDSGWFHKGLAIEADVPRDATHDDLIFDFAPVASGYGWVFPKDNHVNIGLYTIDRKETLNRNTLMTYIRKRLGNEANPESVVGQYIGFGAARHVVRPDHILLIGDAGGFVDPLTGEGIYGAVVSGQAAAASICAHLDEKATVSDTYIRLTKNLRENLKLSERAAASFYANPQRGFRAMKIPLLRTAILKSYADGLQLSTVIQTTRRFLPRS